MEYEELYKLFVNLLKKANLVFSYLCLDELYTFYGKKGNKAYVWTTVGVTKTGRKFYFYFLSKKKNIESLLSFNFDLPKAEKYYTDGHFAYSNVYGKQATQEKSKYTNLIENLNSQMRDKISYLVRKTKSHAKSFEWLNRKLAMFFAELNLKGHKIAI
ncbi:IS1 family transposase [Caminibacter profundus]